MADSKVQLIDSLIQEVTKFKMTDDNALITAREWLSDKLDSYRATVLKKAIREKQDISSAYQIINCLKPKCLGTTCEVEGISIVSKSDIWEVEIPELLDTKKSIKYFGLIDLQNSYNHVELFGMSVKKSRWGRDVRKFTRIGNRIFYHNFDGTRVFALIGILANPGQACDYKSSDPYPLGKEHQEQLLLLVKKDLFTMLQIPIDQLDDTKDNQGAVKVNKDGK